MSCWMASNYKKTAGIQFVANLSITNDSICIELGFWESLGSFSSSAEIKLSEIAHIEAIEEVKMKIFGFRMVGTGLPRLVVLGHFRKDGKKMMVYWVRGQQAVVIDLKSGPYQKMIIGCTNAKALAKELSLGV